MLAVMDNTVRGFFFLAAIVVWLLATFAQDKFPKIGLVALGLLVFAIPFCYDAFDS